MGTVTATPGSSNITEESTTVAEPDSAASPTPPVADAPADAPAPAEGDATTEEEGDEYEPSAEEIEAAQRVLRSRAAADLVKGIVDEEIAAREPELLSKAQQTLATRDQEMTEGEKARAEHYDTAESTARTSATFLQSESRAGRFIDNGQLEDHVTNIISGALAMTAKANEDTITKAMDDFLPDQSPEETKELDQLWYDFRRNGRIDLLIPKMFEMKQARIDNETKGLRAEAKDKKSLKDAADKLREGLEAAGPGAGSQVPRGSRRAGGNDTTYQQYLAMKPQDQQRFQREHNARYRELHGMPPRPGSD